MKRIQKGKQIVSVQAAVGSRGGGGGGKRRGKTREEEGARLFRQGLIVPTLCITQDPMVIEETTFLSSRGVFSLKFLTTVANTSESFKTTFGRQKAQMLVRVSSIKGLSQAEKNHALFQLREVIVLVAVVRNILLPNGMWDLKPLLNVNGSLGSVGLKPLSSVEGVGQQILATAECL